jgi:hypothetical protein
VNTRGLSVSDVVRRIPGHGTAGGSRIDLTVALEGDGQTRLTYVPARHLLNYAHIRRLVLPHLGRSTNRIWSELLGRAFRDARVEAFGEGEDLLQVVAEEIRSLLERWGRGTTAADLRAGKTVAEGKDLLVAPKRLIAAVRLRLPDEALRRSDVAMSASGWLGMRAAHPWLPDGRPRAWAFPLPLPALDEDGGPWPTPERAAAGAIGSIAGRPDGPEKPVHRPN